MKKVCKIVAVAIAVIFVLGIVAACGKTVEVESVTLDKTAVTLDVGASTRLTATVAPSDATNKTVTWSSSDASVATVSDGTVTAVAEGTTTVTATAGGKSATCTVTVNVPVVYTVTADEWTAAIAGLADAQNFTLLQGGAYIRMADGSRAVYYYPTKQQEPYEPALGAYVEKSDTDYKGYAFDEDTQKWELDYDVTWYIMTTVVMEPVAEVLGAVDYSKLVYDAETHMYTYTDTEGQRTFKFIFQDKQLYWARWEYYIESMSTWEELKDLGTTVVESPLPKD